MRAGPLPINTPLFEKARMYGVTREGIKKQTKKNLTCESFIDESTFQR